MNFDDFKCITLEELKEACEKDMYSILSGTLTNSPLGKDQAIRVAVEDGDFRMLHYGEFLFFADSTYMLTEDAYLEDRRCDDLLESFIEGYHAQPNLNMQRKFIVRVYYAGLQTNFLDDKGTPIFEGDLVHATFLTNPSAPAQGGKYRASDIDLETGIVTPGHDLGLEDLEQGVDLGVLEMMGKFAIIGDNHEVPLCNVTSVLRIGTVFVNLDPCSEDFDYRGEVIGLPQSRMTREQKIEWLDYRMNTPRFAHPSWQKANDGAYIN